MGQLLTHIIVLLSSILAAAILMPWLLRLCYRFKLTEETDDNYHFRIPRVGGMILAPAAMIGLLLSIVIRQYYGTIEETFKSSSVFIGVGVLMMYLLGLIDDIFGLNRWQKRILLISVSVALPLCHLYINDLYGILGIYLIDYNVGFILTVILTIIVSKGISSLNDSDGLSGSICMLPLLVFSVIFFRQQCYGYSTMAVAMVGALAVCMYYNVFGDQRIGTKTYMGHAAALMLSYCIVYLSLKYAMKNPDVMVEHSDGLVLPFSMLLIPIFEYVRVWVYAVWMGLSKTERKNLYIQHKLESRGYGQKQIMLIIFLADVAFAILNMLLFQLLNVGFVVILLIDVVLYAVCQYFSVHHQLPVKREALVPQTYPSYNGEEGLVSVIMPTWNSSRYVASSIKSILEQTYTNWELIITDDCSTDNTMSIVRDFAERDKRIRVLSNQKNSGAGIARTNSISAARGRYIAFCDSDDRWTPNKLERQLDFMRSKNVALCFAPYYSCDSRDQYLGYISAPQRVNLFQMMCDNKIGFLTAIYDTALLGKHPMPTQRKRQDHAMLLNLLKICHFAYSVQEPLAHYRIHSGNMSGNKISLIKYNAHTYTEVFGWPKPLSYIFLFTFFMPTYFYKKFKNMLITIIRAAK